MLRTIRTNKAGLIAGRKCDCLTRDLNGLRESTFVARIAMLMTTRAMAKLDNRIRKLEATFKPKTLRAGG